jgi:hypothetical protein
MKHRHLEENIYERSFIYSEYEIEKIKANNDHQFLHGNEEKLASFFFNLFFFFFLPLFMNKKVCLSIFLKDAQSQREREVQRELLARIETERRGTE